MTAATRLEQLQDTPFDERTRRYVLRFWATDSDRMLALMSAMDAVGKMTRRSVYMTTWLDGLKHRHLLAGFGA